MPNRQETHTPVILPLNQEMTEALKRILNRAVSEGHGQITITISTQQVKIVDLAEHRFAWV